MKRLFTFLLTLFLVAASSLAPVQSKACDRSSLDFDSLVASGPNYILYVTLCIGTGRNGIIQGGDQNTGRFSFGFYDSNPGFNISSVNPTTVVPALYASTGPYSTTAPGGGIFCPPTPDPFGNDCMVNYGPVIGGRFLGCIVSTLNCGDTATQCFQFSFTFNQIPDSVRAFGVEGGNIATNGCFPNADMLVDLSSLPIVWGSFAGSPEVGGIALSWVAFGSGSLHEYQIQRSADGIHFESIGTLVRGFTENSKAQSFDFFDPNPSVGINYYQVVELNETGKSSTSEVIQVMYQQPTVSQWNFVAPVPSAGDVTLSFVSPTEQGFTLSVMDTRGALVHQSQIAALVGTTERTLDMASWRAGCYFVRLQGADGSVLEKKIIKL